MIPQVEFHRALHCAMFAADPSNSPRQDLQGVLLDFLPDDTLRVVGTNGQRMTIVTLQVAHGAAGRIFLSDADCNRTLLQFGPALKEIRAQLYMLGEAVILTNGTDTLELPHSPVEDYWEYESGFQPCGAAIGIPYRLDYLQDALQSAVLISDGTVRIVHGVRSVILECGIAERWKQIKRVQMCVMPVAAGGE